MVGIGPGHPLDRTRRAEQSLREASVIVGYRRYLDLVADLCDGKRVIGSGMRQETERCRVALAEAESGFNVALISSGDPGIYGMAGLLLELAHRQGSRIPIVVVPGVTAGGALAAQIGAPLMLDYASISLSDLLVPWETIRHRLEHVAAADLVCVLYNPRSRKRVFQLEEAVAIFLKHRPANTPVGIGTALGTRDELIALTDLGGLLGHEVGMRSTVVIGNRGTKRLDGWLITPRGYRL